ncbi:MAG: aminoacyl-tRNA hydrolase [bacterium]|nr:aminoacyl-tRNA hydrolase [bacterium]
MVAVIGLGNPGAAYAATRHNVGFSIVDELGRKLEATPWSDHGAYSKAVVRVAGRNVWLVKPTTYMNRSGTAVESLVRDLEIESDQVLVVVDDVDLDLGRLRLRRSGGSGTHNGLRDIVALIGAEFPRLRVGVGGADPADDLADFVLSPFGSEDLEVAEASITRSVQAVLVSLTDGLKPAMDIFNRNADAKAAGKAPEKADKNTDSEN